MALAVVVEKMGLGGGGVGDVAEEEKGGNSTADFFLLYYSDFLPVHCKTIRTTGRLDSRIQAQTWMSRRQGVRILLE